MVVKTGALFSEHLVCNAANAWRQDPERRSTLPNITNAAEARWLRQEFVQAHGQRRFVARIACRMAEY